METETAAVVGRTAGALAAVKNSSTLSVCSATPAFCGLLALLVSYAASPMKPKPENSPRAVGAGITKRKRRVSANLQKLGTCGLHFVLDREAARKLTH